jgi:hypothetical protein
MNPIILVVSIITTLIFLIAWLYEYNRREILTEQLRKATLTNANLSEALKAANTQASIDSFNAKAARAISRDLSSDVVELQANLKQTEVAYDMLAKRKETMLGEKEQAELKYRNLIAMPRRKREALVKELRAEK